MRTNSRDGTELALHDFGGVGPPLLIAHATGFLAAVYRPLAERLQSRFRCYAIDFRSHGDSSRARDLTWTRMAEDVLAAVDALGLDRPFAFGHSMGGAALTRAELDEPRRFRAFYLYEPVLVPTHTFPAGDNPMAAAARRRRAGFPTRGAAHDNYASKPPLNALHPDAMQAYVDDGFADGPDGVLLKCTPEDEAETFRGSEGLDAYERLGDLALPVTIAQGSLPDAGPGSFAPTQAAAVPGGRHVVLEGLGHFGPLQDPDLVAASVFAALAEDGPESPPQNE